MTRRILRTARGKSFSSCSRALKRKLGTPICIIIITGKLCDPSKKKLCRCTCNGTTLLFRKHIAFLRQQPPAAAHFVMRLRSSWHKSDVIWLRLYTNTLTEQKELQFSLQLSEDRRGHEV